MTPSSTRRLALWSLVAFLVVASAFAVVDFSLATHGTIVDASTATGHTGEETSRVADGVVLVVFGEDQYRHRVEAALLDEFESRGVDVTLADGVADTDGRGLLVVTVDEMTYRYNPVTPRAEGTWEYVYTASGDSDQIHRFWQTGVMTFTSEDRVAFMAHGELTVRDRTRGVVSWPGYRGHVTDVLANSTVESLVSA